jgi:hypothetical protein
MTPQHRIFTVALAVCPGMTVASPLFAADVRSLSLTGKGYRQVGENVRPIKISGHRIVNAALDIDPDLSSAPATKVLAMIVDCDTLGDIVVWAFKSKLVGVLNYVGNEGRTNSVVIVSGTAALGAVLGSVP